MSGLRYVLASLALGLISGFGSEAFFWSAPQAGPSLAEMVLTYFAYTVASATALGAVALTGCGGMRGAFLGGAMLGFLIEGVVVGTMYDAFPLQLVWTPLAWHALITGVLVFASVRASANMSYFRQVTFLVLLGLAGGLWAGFWPLERSDLPSGWIVLAYLGATGALVPVGNMMLDRIGTVPRPSKLVLAVAPMLLLILWIVASLADPRPQRLALPLLLGLVYWVMARQGVGQNVPDFGAPTPRAWRHWFFLIVPVVTAGLATLLWSQTQGIESNVPFALGGGLVSVLWLGRLAGQSYFATSAARAEPRSSAPS